LETTTIEAEMEATRERLADTIDQLVHRASPKTIARREAASVRAYFVDPQTGQPRTTNILKVAGGLVGMTVLVVVVRTLARD
jgi:AmiR/NasT family two-component response regulator